MPETPTDLLAAALRADPAGPLLTYYDDATGERVELSATTLDNWVAKTANLLQDGFGIQPGDRVGIVLPPHWQTAVALLACWAVGADVRRRSVAEPLLLICEEDLPDALHNPGRPADILAFSLAPLGRGLSNPDLDVVDYATDVLAHGDHFAPYEPVTAELPALDGVSGGELVARARRRATELGIGRGDRLLVSPNETEPVADPILDMLLVPLVAGASVVLCRHAGPDSLADRARQERVTVSLGTAVAGVRLVGG